MQSLGVERFLSAIVIVDVVGYLCLIESEENAIVASWLLAQRHYSISLARFDREGDTTVTDWKELHSEIIAINVTCLLLDNNAQTELYAVWDE